MTFTYAGTLATDLDKIRFKVQDTTSGSGPKPNGGNFTDEEINGLLTMEGSINRTIAALYETLAMAWATYVDSQIGERRESLSQVADRYSKMAAEWRKEYGHGSVSISAGYVTRSDGYSTDIDAGGGE